MLPSYQELEKLVKNNNPSADLSFLYLAYDFAKEAHREQKRVNGEPYINHALATAIYLAKIRTPLNIIIAGLLHDIPEETKINPEILKKNFGKDIANIVKGITKLGKIKYRGIERYAENLRKMFIAMAVDLRTILVKFADRIHNLQTLWALPRKKQIRIAKESIEIYAPIANRLGMGKVKGDLEDEAFPYLYPEEYRWVKSLVEKELPKKEKYLKGIIKEIEKILKKET